MSLKKKQTKIIILCGGFGKRLGKITKKIPKPMVKLGKLTIIEQKLNYYKKQGLENFIFCLGYKSNVLKKFLKKICKNSTIYANGIKPGILKRIFLAKNSINTTTIVSYGDTLAKINFNHLLNNHRNSGSLFSIVVSPIKNPFGLVEWDNKDRVTNFKEKPILNHFIGYAVVEPEIFNFIPKKIINLKNGEGMVKAIQILSRKKLVNVYRFKGLHMTINSSNELSEAKKRINKYFTFDEILQ